MIRRAASRSARSVRPVDKPPPLPRSTAKLSPTADSDTELRNRVDHHVERHNKVAKLYSHLADKFNELRNEAGCVLDAFQDTASPPEGLRASVDWLMEQRPVIVKSNEQLHRKIQELREDLPDVSHLVEKFQALEKTSMYLGEHVDVLQQGIMALCMEFARGFPDIEEPAEVTHELHPVESSIETAAEVASEPASLVEQLLVESPNDSLVLAVDPETPQPISSTTGSPEEPVLKSLEISFVEPAIESSVNSPVEYPTEDLEIDIAPIAEEFPVESPVESPVVSPEDSCKELLITISPSEAPEETPPATPASPTAPSFLWPRCPLSNCLSMILNPSL
jgi:hypothetical protein